MKDRIASLEKNWATSRFANIKRDYNAHDVIKLQGTLAIENTLAKYGANKFYNLLQNENFVTGMGAVTSNQAMQQVRAGIKIVYISGWQIAADNNSALNVYPDLSLYPVNSGPNLVTAINNALLRQDKIDFLEDKNNTDWLAPIMIDAEAGFGGMLNVFELTQNLIKAGVAAIHFEDQAPSFKRCGHLGGKVIVPVSEALDKLKSARLAADVMNVNTVIIARTDSFGASYITSDVDELDRKYITNKRIENGNYCLNATMDYAIERALKFAPYVDMLWCETGKPSLDEAKAFANAIHKEYPGKPLVYNCSPSFNWRKYLSDKEIMAFQQQLADLGYKIQLVTLAGFHSLNSAMYSLASEVAKGGLIAYTALQQEEFGLQAKGFSALKHQHEVGTSYYETIINKITNAESDILKYSTESKF